MQLVFNIGGNLVQFSGATALASNTAAAVTQAAGGSATVTTAASSSNSANPAQVQPISVPQTVGSNIVMASSCCGNLL